MDDSPCILIECPMCRESLDCPELLCEHMVNKHDKEATVHDRTFENKEQFQNWLSAVEASRTSQSGMMAGTSEDISDNNDGEYYLLCGHTPSPTAKRRRYNRIKEDSLNNNYCQEDLSSTVMCTAFVHIKENNESGFSVSYCLDHCAHTPVMPRRKRNTTERCNLKRTLDASQSEDIEYGEDVHSHKSSSSDEDSVTSSESKSDDKFSFSAQTVKTPMDSVVEEFADFDLSTVNSHISQRLDSTADRLKALTKVLAELAVDIKACEETRVCSVAV